jgi:hypothetical protein
MFSMLWNPDPPTGYWLTLSPAQPDAPYAGQAQTTRLKIALYLKPQQT